MERRKQGYVIAWAMALLFYIAQYSTRSAPAVMLDQLQLAFGQTAAGVSAILSICYYTYAIVSLIAGVALDRLGAKYIIPIGLAIFSAGCLLFVVPDTAYAARMLQGAGSAFAFTGAVYLAARAFSPAVLATAIGVTQSVGMLGGSAGQFVVGPLIQGGMPWASYWLAVGLVGIVLTVGVALVTPGRERTEAAPRAGLSDFLKPYAIVLGNPQSLLCGLVAGLMFAPTTIGIMTWGVAFLQADRGFAYQTAVFSASMVPLGWAVGCPLLGWAADRLGRRKPVILGGAAFMAAGIAQVAFVPQAVPAVLMFFLLGVASGAAMIPYTMIKELNPDEVKGSATGAINFINFSVTSLVAPVFASWYGRTLSNNAHPLEHFQKAGTFWLAIVVFALLFSLWLRETGRNAVRS